jgi:hypothetical protein
VVEVGRCEEEKAEKMLSFFFKQILPAEDKTSGLILTVNF